MEFRDYIRIDTEEKQDNDVESNVDSQHDDEQNNKDEITNDADSE